MGKMTSLLDLPDDIVLHILKYYVQTESQRELMEQVSKVDLRWRNICLDYTLWIKYDGTLPFKEMMLLLRKDSFKKTKEFTFSNAKKLEDNEVSEIFSKLINVEFFNFSNLENLSPNIFDALEKKCPNLCKIQFQNHETFSNLDMLTNRTYRTIMRKHLDVLTIEYQNIVNYKTYINDHETNDFKRIDYSLGSFFAARGQSLISIDFSYCLVYNVSRILSSIADCCPNLEQLYLIGIYCSVSYLFPTETLQKKCPKLKKLHLDYNIFISPKTHPEGFPNLENFSSYDPIKNVGVQKFAPILFRSKKLKCLNLPLSQISILDLLTIPARALEHLNISNSYVCNLDDLYMVTENWCYSLKEVDLSFAECCSALNKAVSFLVCKPPTSPLEKLNLRNTEIWSTIVLQVLENCHKLKELNLTQCKFIDDSLQRVYYGKTELNKLLETLWKVNNRSLVG